MIHILLRIMQVLIIIGIAPLAQGIIKKAKALLQGRHGPPIWQPYYDLRKYMRKDEVISDHASWIFLMTPQLVIAVTIVAAAMIPAVMTGTLLSFTGELVILVYLFGLTRFFTALSGLDTGSSFGAMGSSRDMFVSGLAEPVLFVTLLAIALPMKTTSLTLITDRVAANQSIFLSPSYYLALLAFFILIMTETGRIPIDNPDTHLELTMIHEGMLLEYSGKRLALMMWSAWIKQVLMVSLLIDFFVPWGVATTDSVLAAALGLVLYALKVIVVAVVVAFIEMSYAKMRFFRIPRLLSAAFIISIVAIAAQYLL